MKFLNLNFNNLFFSTSFQLSKGILTAGLLALFAEPSQALIFRTNGAALDGTARSSFNVDADLTLAPGEENVGTYKSAVTDFTVSLLVPSSSSVIPTNLSAIISLEEPVDFTVTCCEKVDFATDLPDLSITSLDALRYSFNFSEAEVAFFTGSGLENIGEIEKVSGRYFFWVPRELGLEGVGDESDIPLRNFSSGIELDNPSPKLSELLQEIPNEDAGFRSFEDFTVTAEDIPQSVPESNAAWSIFFLGSFIISSRKLNLNAPKNQS